MDVQDAQKLGRMGSKERKPVEEMGDNVSNSDKWSILSIPDCCTILGHMNDTEVTSRRNFHLAAGTWIRLRDRDESPDQRLNSLCLITDYTYNSTFDPPFAHLNCMVTGFKILVSYR